MKKLPVNGHRISSLPVTRYCPHAADDSVSGRAAAVSTAFHALAAGGSEATSLFAALSDEEQAEVSEWKQPTPLQVGGLTLPWSEAQHELAMGLTDQFEACAYDAPERMTQGTADAVWFCDDHVVVGDLKRSTYRISVTSEQLLAYALAALALPNSCEPKRYTTALWDLVEGRWTVGPTFEVGSLEYAEHRMIVRQAALNLPSKNNGYSIGGHCASCYHRPRCPAYLMPMSVAETDLKPFTAAVDFDLLDPGERLRLKVAVDRMKETIKVAEGVIKESSKRVPIQDFASSKEYREVTRKGSSTLDKKALEKDHPGLLAKYTKEGAPIKYCDWRRM